MIETQSLPSETAKGSPRKLRFCVNGEWRDSASGKYMPVYNPSTGAVMAETPCCTPQEVEEAVGAAQSAFPEWSSAPVGVGLMSRAPMGSVGLTITTGSPLAANSSATCSA